MKDFIKTPLGALVLAFLLCVGIAYATDLPQTIDGAQRKKIEDYVDEQIDSNGGSGNVSTSSNQTYSAGTSQAVDRAIARRFLISTNWPTTYWNMISNFNESDLEEWPLVVDSSDGRYGVVVDTGGASGVHGFSIANRGVDPALSRLVEMRYETANNRFLIKCNTGNDDIFMNGAGSGRIILNSPTIVSNSTLTVHGTGTFNTNVTVLGNLATYGLKNEFLGGPLVVSTNIALMGIFSNATANSNPAIQIMNDVGQFNMQVVGARADNFEIYDDAANVTRLAITTGGLVGIGPDVTSPSATLDVVGAVEFNGGFTNLITTTSPAVFLNSTADSNPQVRIQNDAQEWGLQTVGARNDDFEFYNDTRDVIALSISTNSVASFYGDCMVTGGVLTVVSPNPSLFSMGTNFTGASLIESTATQCVLRLSGKPLPIIILKDRNDAQECEIIADGDSFGFKVAGDTTGSNNRFRWFTASGNSSYSMAERMMLNSTSLNTYVPINAHTNMAAYSITYNAAPTINALQTNGNHRLAAIVGVNLAPGAAASEVQGWVAVSGTSNFVGIAKHDATATEVDTSTTLMMFIPPNAIWTWSNTVGAATITNQQLTVQ